MALTFGARLFMAANSVIAGVLIARFLGADSLGVYLVLTVAVQILIQVCGFALHLANTYFVARSPEKLIPLAINSLVFGLFSGSLGAVFVWLFAGRILPDVPDRLALIGLVAVPFYVIIIYVLNLFLALNDVRKFNSIELATQSFVLINAIVVLVILGGGVEFLVSLNTGAVVVMTFVAVGMFYQHASSRFPKARWNGEIALLRPVLRYSLRGFILWASMFLVYRLDLILLNYFRGPAESAVYAVATQYTLFLLLLPHAVSHLLQARVSATQDEGGEFTCRVARHTSLVLFGACLVSLPIAYGLSSVYGPGFGELPLQIWILLPGVYFVGVQVVVVQYFVGRGMPYFLSVAWLVTVFVNIALNLFGVPLYGAIGAALISTLCYSCIAGTVLVFFRAETKFSLRAVFVPTADEIKKVPDLFRPGRHATGQDSLD